MYYGRVPGAESKWGLVEWASVSKHRDMSKESRTLVKAAQFGCRAIVRGDDGKGIGAGDEGRTRAFSGKPSRTWCL